VVVDKELPKGLGLYSQGVVRDGTKGWNLGHQTPRN